MDNDDGTPRNDTPQAGAFQTEKGGQHLKAHQRQNGKKSCEHGAVGFFDGEGGNIGDENGDDQLRGL